MITFGYSVIAVIAFSCFVFGVRAYISEPNKILFLILINTSLLWFDSFVTAIGQYTGEGTLLLVMTYIRYASTLAHSSASFYRCWNDSQSC